MKALTDSEAERRNPESSSQLVSTISSSDALSFGLTNDKPGNKFEGFCGND